MNNSSSIASLVELLEHIFEDLGVVISSNQVDAIAMLAYNAMNAHTRLYHNLDHVFNFTDPDDPIVHLAAVFHDIIYYQVDKGVYHDLEPLIYSFIRQKEGRFFLSDHPFFKETLGRDVLFMFNFQIGERLTISSGLNEFLSTLVMINVLKNLVDEQVLFKTAICIEATIPFRGLDERGKTHFEVLEERLTAICTTHHINCTDYDIDSILRRAVLFSNKDVETFAEENCARFLDSTWKLLPESNISLRFRGIYTVREYRLALQNMENFLSSLKAETIFSRYHDTPGAREYDKMVMQAQINISTAVLYLRIKLIASAILEALAEYSGGDAPLSLFVGDLPKPAENFRRIEDFLPVLPKPEFSGIVAEQVFQLLETGRSSETLFDSKHSPLSLYVYKQISLEDAQKLFTSSMELFRDRISATEFLKIIPESLLHPIILACSQMAYTRRAALLSLLERLQAG